jgi:hypothetical protein
LLQVDTKEAVAKVLAGEKPGPSSGAGADKKKPKEKPGKPAPKPTAAKPAAEKAKPERAKNEKSVKAEDKKTSRVAGGSSTTAAKENKAVKPKKPVAAPAKKDATKTR